MLINKEEFPVVAMDFMNDVHHEDIDIVNSLYENAQNYEKNKTKENEILINEKYEQWFEHTINHFRGEEVEMEKKSFPPFAFHKAEHDNALGQMEKVYSNWKETKDIKALKNYLETDLIEWLARHVSTMDTVTASFLKTGVSPCSVGA